MDVDQRLSFYRTATHRVLERYLPEDRASPDVPAAATRLGRFPSASGEYLADAVCDYPLRPGKGLRASLCIAASRAFGGSGTDALLPAAALELLHAAFLVHDDIQDGSAHRRGQPTLHRRFGLPLALNAGDALALLSFEPLQDANETVGSRIATLLMAEFRCAIWRTLEGQALELGWRADGVVDLGVADYLGLVLRKTSFYTTILPLRMGAIVARGGAQDLDSLSRFGAYLGAAFQIQDDLLNLVGEGERYGKEIDGDLYEGKRSLPIIHLLNTAVGTDREAVARFLAMDRSERTTDDIDRIRELLDHHGSIAFCRAVARQLRMEAIEEQRAAFAGAEPNNDIDFIARLVDFVTDRQA